MLSNLSSAWADSWQVSESSISSSMGRELHTSQSWFCKGYCGSAPFSQYIPLWCTRLLEPPKRHTHLALCIVSNEVSFARFHYRCGGLFWRWAKQRQHGVCNASGEGVCHNRQGSRRAAEELTARLSDSKRSFLLNWQCVYVPCRM